MDFTDVAIAKYVAYLFECGLKYNTIQCHLVAIAHGLNAKKLPDTTKSYLVARMVLGAKKLTFSRDIRKPFTEQMIVSIVKALPYLVFSSYEIHLYWAVLAWAFGAGLRVSEYTQSKTVDHNIHYSSIDTVAVDGELAFRVTFRSFKSCPDQFPDFILIQNDNISLCPVSSMVSYLERRPQGDGPLFLTPKGPLERKDVEQLIAKACDLFRWSKTCYHTHSLRIGRATLWAKQGYNAVQIQNMGRWKSDAFLRYIRPEVIYLR